MNRAWPVEAVEYEATVRAALANAGGVDLARRAEADPAVRLRVVKSVLESLEIFDLDPASDSLEAMVAVRAAQAAGSCLCPWPLVQALAVPSALRGQIGAVYLGEPGEQRLEHADLFPRAAIWSLKTHVAHVVSAASPMERMPLDPFGANVVVGDDVVEGLEAAAAISMILAAYWTLGALSYAADLATEYAATRRQFGRRISEFGGIQLRLAEMALGRDALSELAAYTLWLNSCGRASHADLLALRLGMLESASTVLLHAHQIFASIGLCEEHDLAIIDRHLQPMLRRPSGRAATAELLADRIRLDGFAGIFPIAPSAKTSSVAQTSMLNDVRA